MNNSTQTQIKETAEVVKKAANQEVADLPGALSEVSRKVDKITDLVTPYQKNLESVKAEMKKRIDSLDVEGLQNELAKMKGQGEARYQETIGKITSLAAAQVTTTAQLMEQAGIPLPSEKFLDNVKKGFLVFGDKNPIRISIAQLIADAYLLRNTTTMFQVGHAMSTNKMTDFFYANNARESICIPSKPKALKAGTEITIPLKDVVSISAAVNGAGFYALEGMTTDEAKAAIATAAVPNAEVTYSEDTLGVVLVKIKNTHASNALIVCKQEQLTLRTVLSLKKALVGIVSLTLGKVHGALGIASALFGEEAISRLQGDLAQELPASIFS